MFEEKYCKGCTNHCPIDNLKCHKGHILANSRSKNESCNSKKNDRTGKQIINLFREIGHEIHFNSEGRGGQKRILIMLNELGSIPQVELTRLLNIKSGSASEILAKLESQNLIERIPSDIDNRTMNVKITEQGKKEAELAKDEQKRFYKSMLKNLSDEEKKKLLELLSKVNFKKNNHHKDTEHKFHDHKHHCNHKKI